MTDLEDRLHGEEQAIWHAGWIGMRGCRPVAKLKAQGLRIVIAEDKAEHLFWALKETAVFFHEDLFTLKVASATGATEVRSTPFKAEMTEHAINITSKTRNTTTDRVSSFTFFLSSSSSPLFILK